MLWEFRFRGDVLQRFTGLQQFIIKEPKVEKMVIDNVDRLRLMEILDRENMTEGEQKVKAIVLSMINTTIWLENMSVSSGN